MIDISRTGEVYLLDPELGKMVVYRLGLTSDFNKARFLNLTLISTKGSMIRSFSFSIKGSTFVPMAFACHGEKLLLAEENCIVLASPIDGLIFK